MSDTKELVTITKVDFAAKKAESRWQVEAEKGVPRFLRDLARIAKEEDIKSVLVLTVTAEDHVEWFHLMDSEHDHALAILCLKDVESDMKAELFKEYLDEEE